MDEGVNVCVSVDNATVSNVTLSEEFCKLQAAFNFSVEEMVHMLLNSFRNAFVTQETRNRLCTAAFRDIISMLVAANVDVSGVFAPNVRHRYCDLGVGLDEGPAALSRAALAAPTRYWNGFVNPACVLAHGALFLVCLFCLLAVYLLLLLFLEIYHRSFSFIASFISLPQLYAGIDSFAPKDRSSLSLRVQCASRMAVDRVAQCERQRSRQGAGAIAFRGISRHCRRSSHTHCGAAASGGGRRTRASLQIGTCTRGV